MSTHNDQEFKVKLALLPLAHQRHLAALFVERLLPLCDDFRVKAALEVARRPDVPDSELAVAAQTANAARVESYTRCGHETDWTAQAGHFVARAAVACVRPAGEGENLAWEAAMQARMARTCESVAAGEGTGNHEAEEQYRILLDFLSA
jgi:hypothetical protein